MRNDHGEESARHALSARTGVTVLDPAHNTGPRTDQPRTPTLLAEVVVAQQHTIAEILDDEARTAASTDISYTAFLARLIDAEIAAKVDRSVQTRISLALPGPAHAGSV